MDNLTLWRKKKLFSGWRFSSLSQKKEKLKLQTELRANELNDFFYHFEYTIYALQSKNFFITKICQHFGETIFIPSMLTGKKND
jgi:hypothetical protein